MRKNGFHFENNLSVSPIIMHTRIVVDGQIIFDRLSFIVSYGLRVMTVQ